MKRNKSVLLTRSSTQKKIVSKKRKKLNIAIVSDAVDYTSGSSISSIRFSKLLIKRGHNVVIIAAKTPYESPEIKDIKTYRFRSFAVPKAEGKFFLAFPTVQEAKDILIKEKIDIVHIIIPFEAGYSFLEAAHSLNIKVITHSHTQAENVFLHVPKILGRDILSDIFTRYLFWMYEHSDALVYPTEFAREKSPKMAKSMRYEIISNGVDTSLFKPANRNIFLKEFNLPAKNKYITFVGRLHPEKNIITLIKAVPEIIRREPLARVLIIGEGHQSDYLKSVVSKMNLDKYITFLGRIDSKHLAPAYSSCSIFCLPSLAELEGMVVLEAMACGAPILIANAENSASKFFVKDNGMLFKATSYHNLAEKAVEMLSDSKKLNEMSKNSLRESKLYDINESVKRLEDLYYSVLGI
jgi:1,2-diacylglycerol 3-alpha-glucosyltransferase